MVEEMVREGAKKGGGGGCVREKDAREARYMGSHKLVHSTYKYLHVWCLFKTAGVQICIYQPRVNNSVRK
jgi:hypothetical protein